MQRIYLDSNVFISLFSKELGRNVRGLFVEAEGFFERVKQKNHILILSSLFFEEVQKQTYLSEDEVTAYLKEHRVSFETARIKPGLPWRKFVARGLHYSDALHMAAAIAFKCDCIVTVKNHRLKSVAWMVFDVPRIPLNHPLKWVEFAISTLKTLKRPNMK